MDGSRFARASGSGAAAVFAAASVKVSPPGNVRRKSAIASLGGGGSAGWGAAVAQVSALEASMHNDGISHLSDSTLRNLAVKVVVAQEGCVQARADAAAAEKAALDELDHVFLSRLDDKLLAKVPMNRVSKGLLRVSDAAAHLDSELNAFMVRSLQLHNIAEDRRRNDLRQVSDEMTGMLDASEGQRHSLEAQSATERLERLKAALRLTKNWMKMSATLRREQEAVITLLTAEIVHLEDEVSENHCSLRWHKQQQAALVRR